MRKFSKDYLISLLSVEFSSSTVIFQYFFITFSKMIFTYIAKMSRGVVAEAKKASRQNDSMRWNSNAVDTAGIFQF